MILLHGFFKTTERTPKADLELAAQRKQKHQRSA
jgi:phage-related protein